MRYTVVFKDTDGKRRQYSTDVREGAFGVAEAVKGTVYRNHKYGRVKL